MTTSPKPSLPPVAKITKDHLPRVECYASRKNVVKDPARIDHAIQSALQPLDSSMRRIPAATAMQCGPSINAMQPQVPAPGHTQTRPPLRSPRARRVRAMAGYGARGSACACASVTYFPLWPGAPHAFFFCCSMSVSGTLSGRLGECAFGC